MYTPGFLSWIAIAFALPLYAIELNLSSPASLKTVSSDIAYDLMSIYRGNYSGGIPGTLPAPPYYWWEGGGLWGVMMNYWYTTNDTSYNDVITEGMLFQVGPDKDYLPPNQTNGMGNDDQGFWGLAAMTAAELNFPNPPPSSPQWLALAQAVFNEFITRTQLEIEQNVCGGGLRWQVYFYNDGWTYKNSISSACMFNLGARLARYTGNDTYSQWADTTWDWVARVGLLELQPYSLASKNFSFDGRGAGGYVIWDGTTVESNCTRINGIPYTYNAAVFLLGAATMYNHTGSELWANRTMQLLNATINVFFPNQICFEPSCESQNTCDTDMLSFKAYLVRSMVTTSQLFPQTLSLIAPVLRASAIAAMKQCTGGPNGRMCGLKWNKVWDGTMGAGQQMAALEVVLANMDRPAVPVTLLTGGTSPGDPGAGTKLPHEKYVPVWTPPTKAANAAAAILTMIMIGGIFVIFAWICLDDEWPGKVVVDLAELEEGKKGGRVLTPHERFVEFRIKGWEPKVEVAELDVADAAPAVAVVDSGEKKVVPDGKSNAVEITEKEKDKEVVGTGDEKKVTKVGVRVEEDEDKISEIV